MNSIEGYSTRITTEEGEDIIITSTKSTKHLIKYLNSRRLVEKTVTGNVRKSVTVGFRDFAKLKNGLADSERIVKQKIGCIVPKERGAA